MAIAFATTCAGLPGPGNQKEEIGNARKQFAMRLVTGLNVCRKTTGDILIKYDPGNCPEYLTVIIICRRIGEYSSLCQNVYKNLIYKMCEYCAELAIALKVMGVNISDLWNRSELGEGDVVEVAPEQAFSSRGLMEYSTVAKRFSQVRGVV